MSDEVFENLIAELRAVQEKLPEKKGVIKIEMSQGGVRQITVEASLK